MIGVMKMTALAKTIETLLENKKYSSLRDVLSSMNEADIAAMFSEVSSDSLPLLFRLLPKDLAADTFALMDTDEQELLIRGFSDNEIAMFLQTQKLWTNCRTMKLTASFRKKTPVGKNRIFHRLQVLERQKSISL